MVVVSGRLAADVLHLGLISGYLEEDHSGRQTGFRGRHPSWGLNLAGIQFPGKRKSSLICRHSAADIAAKRVLHPTMGAAANREPTLLRSSRLEEFKTSAVRSFDARDLQRYLLPTITGSVSTWNPPQERGVVRRSQPPTGPRSRSRGSNHNLRDFLGRACVDPIYGFSPTPRS